tara:strand:- start:374 stop:1873 length:1500 start_codon:yes stop_codon:yes gene_type:complete|eukprot:9085-Pelagococcus_subviridis.AAC.2
MAPPDATHADAMLTEPSSAAPPHEISPRATLPYVARDSKFNLDAKIYGQYFQLYFNRLKILAPRLEDAVQAKWPNLPRAKVLDLKEGEECVLSGTLYKDMKLKPCILDEYVKEAGVSASAVAIEDSKKTKFVGEDDSIVLEDEGARVKLTGAAIDVNALVTGVVLAARGRVVPGGEFEADEICFPRPAAARRSAAPADASTAAAADLKGKRVVLVSDLRVGDPASSNPLNLELMLDFLTGNLGGAADASEAASVARVVVCGGALSKAEVPASSLDPREKAQISRPLRELDVLLSQLCSSVHVDVMPGEGDPTNQALPQQPLHPCLFPSAARYDTFAASTNPHEFDVGGVGFLGTSGQNISDLCKYTNVRKGGGGEVEGEGEGGDAAAAEERLDLMESSLRWQHLAPSAPDTLACYPYKDRDPFHLDACPDVYFAGCQPAFGSRVVELERRGAGAGAGGETTRTLAVSVPSFAATGTIVMVDLETLTCTPVTFGDGGAAR